MPTEVVQESRPSFGVTFSKKVSDGNYGGDEVSAWVSADVPLDADAEAIAAALNDAAFVAKATVYGQLGVEFQNEDGILRAVTARVQRAFPGTTIEVPPSDNAYVAPPVDLPNASGNAQPVKVKGKQNGELPLWLIEACAEHCVTEVYDNRADLSDPAKANRPHFKPVRRVILPNGKDLAFWPPKGQK